MKKRTTMTHATRAELANAIRSRYRAATGKSKRRILEEFVAATGYHEKSAIRVLNSSPAAKPRQSRQRPSVYDEAARAALIVMWEASDRVCGKRLKALLPILLPALERNGHPKLDENIRPKILSMSASTIASSNGAASLTHVCRDREPWRCSGSATASASTPPISWSSRVTPAHRLGCTG